MFTMFTEGINRERSRVAGERRSVRNEGPVGVDTAGVDQDLFIDPVMDRKPV